MRFLAGSLGAIVGTIVSGLLTLWIVLRVLGGIWTWYLMFLGPAGLLVGLAAGTVCGIKAFDFLRQPDADGALYVKKCRVKTILVLGPLLTVGLSLYGLWHTPNPPSDAAMLAHFAAHRAQFDELAHMTQQDKKLWSVDANNPDSTNPTFPDTIGVTSARLALYRDTLKAAGSDGFGRSGSRSDAEVDFSFWNDNQSQSKDFAYLPCPPAILVPSLDNFNPSNGNALQRYRRIDGNWYLHYSAYTED